MTVFDIIVAVVAAHRGKSYLGACMLYGRYLSAGGRAVFPHHSHCRLPNIEIEEERA